MSVKSSILFRVQLAFGAILVLSFTILIRIVYIQMIDGGRWIQQASESSIQYRNSKALRGNIYAENGVLLGTSVPLFKVSIDPTVIDDATYKKNIDTLCSLLASQFKDKTPEEYLQKINEARKTKKRYLVLSTQLVSFQVKKQMQAWPIFKEGQLKGGVLFERIQKRFYPYEHLAARTVGYINEKDEGVVGLELSFNKFLAGKDGKSLYQKISGGEWKPIRTSAQIKSEDGVDVYTTIDINIQEIAYNALREALVENEANFGCVVVMEVETGYIKAMVNLGKDDIGNYVEKYNYAIGDQGSTDPGSTFKLASLAALFEDNPKIELTDTVETGGGVYKFADRVMRDAGGAYGRISVQKVFEYSSSVGIAKLITKQFGQNPTRYIAYLNKFGLGKSLDFQISGESKPYIKTPSDPTWSDVTLPWMSIGYELKIAPIHTLTFYNAIANRGKLLKPIIVREIKEADKSIQVFNPTILNPKICSDTTLPKLFQMLEGVVQRGTAIGIRNSVYRIAGKTGTAQKIKNGRYIKQYYSSFVGFFPADRPRYTMIVVIDSPQGSKLFGGDLSAPVFKKIADILYFRDIETQRTIASLPNVSAFEVNIPPNNVSNRSDVQSIMNYLVIPNTIPKEGDWLDPKIKQFQVEWETRNGLPGLVPNVTGMTLRDALFTLENKGFKVYYDGEGRVKTQSVMPGDKIPEDKRIVLALK